MSQPETLTNKEEGEEESAAAAEFINGEESKESDEDIKKEDDKLEEEEAEIIKDEEIEMQEEKSEEEDEKAQGLDEEIKAEEEKLEEEAGAEAINEEAKGSDEDLKKEEEGPEELDEDIKKEEKFEEEEEEVPQLDATVPQVQPSLPPARKKKKHISGAQRTMARYKLSVLEQNFRPIPFSPSKTLDFSAHEDLFRALNLWDFANLDLSQEIRPDLLTLLLANYDQSNNFSLVNGVEIAVSKLDLAVALKLPVDKEEGESHRELVWKEDSKRVIEEFVTNYMFLEDEDEDGMFIFPAEVMAATQMVKEGQAMKVDWTGLMWVLVEKEIMNAPRLGSCHYASHLQCLMKYQQPGLFDGKVVGGVTVPEPDSSMDDSVDGEDGDGEDEMRSFEELQDVVTCEKLGPGLSLGLGENGVLMDDIDDCKGGEVGSWVDEGRNEHFEHCLRRCTSNEMKGMEFENLCKGDEEFSNLGRSTSTDLLRAMETVQVSYSPQINHHDQNTGDILSTDINANKNMMLDPDQGPSIFFENNGKRHINNVDIDDDDITQFHQNNQQKRMRSGGLWEEQQAPSGIDSYMEEIQRAMGKAMMLYVEKEQACMNAHLQLQYLNSMVEQKDQIIRTLEKTRIEEQQKWQHTVRRYEHELNIVVELVAGYKKVLKETRDRFAEYRKKCPQGDEPLYRDVGGPGGLVLTSKELEMQRLEKEEELRRTAEELINNFLYDWHAKFDELKDWVTVMHMRLEKLEGEAKLIKESFAESKERFAESKVNLGADPETKVNLSADSGKQNDRQAF